MEHVGAGGLHGLDLADWSLARNLGAAAVVVALLFATWMLTNRLRHRPPLSRPRDLGPPELAAFLIGPALPALVFEQWGDALQAVIEGASVLVVIYVATSYGVVPLMGWAASQTFARLGSVGRMLTRALPLLLLFTTFLFINAEVWQVAGTLQGPVYVVTLGLFFVLGSAFVLSRIPASIRMVHAFDEWEEVARLVQGTPAEGLSLPTDGDPQEMALSIRQRVNIGLVSVFSQAILVTFVAVVLASFFMLFGLLAVPEATTASWTQLADVHVYAHWHVGGRVLEVASSPKTPAHRSAKRWQCASPRATPLRASKFPRGSGSPRSPLHARSTPRHVPPVLVRRLDGRGQGHSREVRRPGNQGHHQHSHEPGDHRRAVR